MSRGQLEDMIIYCTAADVLLGALAPPLPLDAFKPSSTSNSHTVRFTVCSNVTPCTVIILCLVMSHYRCLFTFGRKSLLRVSLADVAFEGSGGFAAAFGSSFGVGFTDLAAGSALTSIFGGSGGGGGGIDIPLGAAGGSDTCAAYSRGTEQSGEVVRYVLCNGNQQFYFPPTSVVKILISMQNAIKMSK